METRLAATLAGAVEREFNAAAALAAAVQLPPSEVAPDEGAAEEKNGAPLPAAEDYDDTRVWPDETAEAAFIAETRGRGKAVPAATPEAVEEADSRPLPTLDELVNRIPSETRELLDELFRVKFTTVRRVPRKVLKG